TGVITAWKLGPDFVKIVPCGHIGGDSYIRDLKAMFPNVPRFAAGGGNQRTPFSFIAAGAVALGVGGELIPREAIRRRQPDRIAELARRFLNAVSSARDRELCWRSCRIGSSECDGIKPWRVACESISRGTIRQC